jgi:protein required for attachment to host cells
MSRDSQQRSKAPPGGVEDARAAGGGQAPANRPTAPSDAEGEAAPTPIPSFTAAARLDTPGADAEQPNPDRGEWADRGVVPRAGGKTRWVLVADEAIARILQWPESGDELDSVEELTDPAAHAREGDLQRDATGRRSGSATHAASPSSPHRLRSSANVTASAGEAQRHLEADAFARRVARHLAEALQRKRYDELALVAAPRFLGLLRKELDPHVAKAVTREIDKDLVHARNDEISRRLADAARGAAASS